MFKTIMVPVDLVHKDKLDRALQAAGDLGRHYGAKIVVVNIGPNTPNELGHRPDEVAASVESFAEDLQNKFDVEVEKLALSSVDPAADMNRDLMKAVDETGADLVIVASHKPGLMEHIFSSHGGYLAQHAKVSVLVVR